MEEFSIVERYSYYIFRVHLAFFFAYPCPLAVLITLLILALQYWVDKCNLFKRSALLYQTNLPIARFSLKMLQFSLLIFALGFFYFSGVLRKNGVDFIVLAGVVLAAVY